MISLWEVARPVIPIPKNRRQGKLEMPHEPLDKYRKKRDFGTTPEPEGRPDASTKPSQRFVVQEHSATRLHYDLRLEIDGLLKSWAIPRGPTLDPAEKRLAVATEDHPLEYAEFEGVIPRGQYGAGNMIVWDRGSYECIGKETDPSKAFRNGTIDLRLHGEKLKGMWLLVRLQGEEDQWLFFKKQDQYADSSVDLCRDMPESVLSGLRVEELTEGTGTGWDSRLDRLLSELLVERAQTPENVRPMLATLASRVPAGRNWVYQLKYDGFRALAEKKTPDSDCIPGT